MRLEQQQELFVLAPLGWEESLDVSKMLSWAPACSGAKDYYILLSVAIEGDIATVSGAVNVVPWIIEERLRLLLLAPLRLEESGDGRNC